MVYIYTIYQNCDLGDGLLLFYPNKILYLDDDPPSSSWKIAGIAGP